MKRRRDVSPQEMPKVISLRQGNASWLKIQKETGIPRRIAKRAYEEWQRGQAFEQVKEARKEVAAEEFRNHLDTLTQTAVSLLGVLRPPSSPGEVPKADDLLELWLRDTSPVERAEPGSHRDFGDNDPRRRERRNRLLFQSLQDHTRGKLRWEALDEWKRAWDTCASLLASLKKQVPEVMDTYLKQKPGLRERIEKASRKDAVAIMVERVLEMVWRGPTGEKTQQKPASFVVSERRENILWVVASTRNPALTLGFGDKKAAEEAAALCNRIASHLLTTQATLIDNIGRELNCMEKRTDELEQILEPLRLRPLILGSRCELCPA